MDRIASLKEFLSQQPDDSFLQHALALEYIKLGDDASARALFERILTRDPGYVGSYYQLAKLLERNNDIAGALAWYEKGITAARQAGEQRAYNELRSAFDELSF
ncbi:MAG TPA: tetratricopeptide repeat protein [Chitinophagaceae bacterium]